MVEFDTTLWVNSITKISEVSNISFTSDNDFLAMGEYKSKKSIDSVRILDFLKCHVGIVHPICTTQVIQSDLLIPHL